MYSGPGRKGTDFGLGFVGGLLLNVIMAAILVGAAALFSGSDARLPRSVSGTDVFLIFCGLPLSLNAAGLLYLAGRRAWIAWGAAAALVTAALALMAIVVMILWSYQVSGY